jgi:hypothetical protein
VLLEHARHVGPMLDAMYIRNALLSGAHCPKSRVSFTIRWLTMSLRNWDDVSSASV